ncbi:MAG TPA: RluA family pseudouridine synthase [Candidatus Saccharimonadales bacterium]|nr:RluA family pseudouridine synthase [Candidatus Saccharimonadales bacterium]
MSAQEQTWTTTEEDAGKRLDVFVAQRMPRLSRAFIQKLADQGKIAVAQVSAKAGFKLKEGQTVSVDYDQAELDEVPVISLPVLYQDDDCVVINKPAGVLTHAQGNLSTEATVATFLRDKLKDLEGTRGGIVHRLDRATSGVIICAKNQAALSFLQKQFQQRKAKKTYMAIVAGHMHPKAAVIDMPIERNPKAPATFRVGPNGKPSTTLYTVISETPSYSLVELKPTTGRTHQLRVHLAEQKHPIIGDPLYGTGTFGERLYLHALSLEITLPNRERRTFEAPLPPEFTQLMEQSDA